MFSPVGTLQRRGSACVIDMDSSGRPRSDSSASGKPTVVVKPVTAQPTSNLLSMVDDIDGSKRPNSGDSDRTTTGGGNPAATETGYYV